MNGHSSHVVFYAADMGALATIIAAHSWTLPEGVTAVAGIWYIIQIGKEVYRFVRGKDE